MKIVGTRYIARKDKDVEATPLKVDPTAVKTLEAIVNQWFTKGESK